MDAHHIRQALAKHLGAHLTPEVAADILSEIARQPDRTIDPERFQPLRVVPYVLAVEKFSDILDELLPLHEAHWAETEGYRQQIALNPDYDFMLDAERDGRLIQFTMRHQGALVGNLRFYLARAMHTSTLVADEDIFYVDPKHRGHGMGMHLLLYAERCLKSLSVREIHASTKLVNKASITMERAGFKAAATLHVKILEA